MNIFFSPSIDNRFTEQYYHVCPACADIPVDLVCDNDRPNLCPHHEHEYQKFLFKKFEKQEEEYLTRQEEIEYLKILHILKNKKEQQNEN